MKTFFKVGSFTSVAFAVIISALVYAIFANTQVAQGDIGGRKIVIWKDGVSEARKNAVISQRGRKVKDIPLVRGTVLEAVSDTAVNALRNSSDVLRIDEDPVAYVAVREIRDNEHARGSARSQKVGTLAPPQVLPWGIDRIDAELVWPSGNTADPIKVGVIDTGISSSHPDLKVNIKGGINTINARKGWNDDNGHGSHVAGIVAAVNNTQGVVGGAPAADLYAIKVLNAQGSGYYSDIIEGLQWAIANNLQVVNMSLGGSADYQPLHDAIVAAQNAGIVIVVAAGNNGGVVSYPGAYPEVITVAATDSSNARPSWSNFGPEVDISAPGVSVYSTYKGTGYATLSGTSMATPHVAAAVALLLNRVVGAYDTNSNNKWDPNEIQTRLQSTATDLGAPAYDNFYGWGLVNAFAAVQ